MHSVLEKEENIYHYKDEFDFELSNYKKKRELNSFLPSMKPFWNSLKPLFQNESSCISVFIRIEIRANYHNNFRT